jgi:hypothetical protein
MSVVALYEQFTGDEKLGILFMSCQLRHQSMTFR